jgi:nucleoside-diphosphate-sugar epimerase
MRVLVAGASGFFAQTLIPDLMSQGHHVTSLDIIEPKIGDSFISCDASDLDELIRKTDGLSFEVVINLATQIDFASKSGSGLYKNNISLNSNLVTLAISKEVRSYVFTSSNSIYLGNKEAVISIDDEPRPIDPYGKSKLSSELEIIRRLTSIPHQIIRCPNIVGPGRVGMLSILFELVNSGAALWVVGKGQVRHQTLFASDLSNYIIKAMMLNTSHRVNLGSERVPTLRRMFEDLCARVGSQSRIRSVPKWLALPAMFLLFWLKISPLGPYQQRMLTRSFEFLQDWRSLPVHWKPTKTNTEMIQIAYESFLRTPHSDSASPNQSKLNSVLLTVLGWIK